MNPIRLSLLADGPRDHATLPLLLATILGRQIAVAGAHEWKGLRLAGGGNARKVAFAMRQAIDEGAAGLVVTADQDANPPRKKLRELRDARDAERGKPGPAAILPVAIGEARPHAEAWLLDDAVAIREGLRLASDHAVPSVRTVSYPKDTIDELDGLGEHPDDERPIDRLMRIATACDPTRCKNAKETGLHDFVDDVKQELGKLP